jgi:hypothetical protein
MHLPRNSLNAGRLLARRRVPLHKEARFSSNSTAKPTQEHVSVAGWAKAANLLGKPLHREGERVIIDTAPLAIRALVLSEKKEEEAPSYI